MNQSDSDELPSSLIIFRSVGYGLLLFILIDFIDIIFPLHFMDPTWEFQTIGTVVERVPLPLIGLLFIFYKEASFRAKWELSVLKLLSRASLLFGILFLLLIFLCVSNALRINKINDDRVNTQINQQLSQVQQIEQQLNKATASELEDFLARSNTKGVLPDVKKPQELKSRLLAEVDKSRSNLKVQAEATRRTRRLALIKSSVKWSLGCLIAGDLFIRIWQATRWARKAIK